jgi:hypothetical protein
MSPTLLATTLDRIFKTELPDLVRQQCLASAAALGLYGIGVKEEDTQTEPIPLSHVAKNIARAARYEDALYWVPRLDRASVKGQDSAEIRHWRLLAIWYARQVQHLSDTCFVDLLNDVEDWVNDDSFEKERVNVVRNSCLLEAGLPKERLPAFNVEVQNPTYPANLFIPRADMAIVQVTADSPFVAVHQAARYARMALWSYLWDGEDDTREITQTNILRIQVEDLCRFCDGSLS